MIDMTEALGLPDPKPAWLPPPSYSRRQVFHLSADCFLICRMHCRLDLAPLNTSTQTLGQVPTRRVWEDVLSVMRIRTFQIIVLQVPPGITLPPCPPFTLELQVHELFRVVRSSMLLFFRMM